MTYVTLRGVNFKPNPPELILLKALWAKGPLPVRKIHDLCVDQLDWSFSSTRKTLSRMVHKGAVRQSLTDGPAQYEARASKTAMLAFLTRDFMYRVLETDGPIPQDIYENSKLLTDDELDELEGLI